jgi:hypothetical protein
MGNLYQKIVAVILLSISTFCCNMQTKQSGTVYELLIGRTYRMDVDTPYIMSQHIILLAREKDSIKQQIYTDYYRRIVDSLSLEFTRLEFTKVKHYLHGMGYIPMEMKKDFNCLPYHNYNINLTKKINTITINQWKNHSIDNIPGKDFLKDIAILIEKDYSLYLKDSTYIPHASKIMEWAMLGRFDDYMIHTFTYDRNRQVIVVSELREEKTHKIIAMYSIDKIIKINKEDFYEFWKWKTPARIYKDL